MFNRLTSKTPKNGNRCGLHTIRKEAKMLAKKCSRILALASILFIVPGFLENSLAGDLADNLFPFVLPWDDSAPSLTNLSHLLHKPAGKFGPIRLGEDGHFYAGRNRMRFFGVNFNFGACFPSNEDARKIARRLAKFGINCARFHHLDHFRAPHGLLARNVEHTRKLDPEALARLDYFIYQLRQNGIYINLNTLVARHFVAADGLPEEIEQLDWKDRAIVGFFYPKMIELQKEYFRNFLLHRNPYTGLTYAEDPAVAFIEIHNENGLLHSWLGGRIDIMPEVFQAELRRQWNAWLKERYESTEKLSEAWQLAEVELIIGNEMLLNADFSAGIENWVLELVEGAEAEAKVTANGPPGADSLRMPAVCIEVRELGKRYWHIQFHQPGLKVQAGHIHTLSFWAKSDKPLTIRTGLRQAYEPWEFLGLSTPINLTREWQKFQFTFRATRTSNNARVEFCRLGAQIANYWFADVSFRPGGAPVILGENEKLEAGTVPIFLRSCLPTLPARADWFRFLWETENNYWRTLYGYLKNELQVQAQIIGTIIGCSTPNLMAGNVDVINAHGYWQHPRFPGRPWDPGDWYIENISMVNARGGGKISHLANRRVLGKPFMVTEYNHAAPNTFSSEAFLFLAAYAAFQDWDGIFAFAYASRFNLNDWDTRKIPNFFDVDQHPTQMVTFIPAVMMFRRADVSPAKKKVVVQLPKEKELSLLPKSSSWTLVEATMLGVERETALVHRVAIATEGRPVPETALNPEQVKLEENKFISDTGELIWDLTREGRGRVIVNSERSKALIGFVGGDEFKLGDVIVKPKETLQDGWCAITLTVMEGENFQTAEKILITATGYAENTNMGWKDLERSTVGRDWGEPPSLVEGIKATIILPVSKARVEVFSLDERGLIKEKLSVTETNGKATFEIGPQYETLWYKVSIR